LPNGAKPITTWQDRDEALHDVAKGIQKEVEKLRNSIPSYKEQPNSRIMPPGTLLLQYAGHADQVTSVAWSPDGKHIASASSDGIAQVWQPDDGEQFFTFNVSNGVLHGPELKPCMSRSGKPVAPFDPVLVNKPNVRRFLKSMVGYQHDSRSDRPSSTLVNRRVGYSARSAYLLSA
jgi:WD40 repeat protein